MSIIFDKIHSAGCKAMERRAYEADPTLKERMDARKTTEGLIIASGDGFTLQEFFDDLSERQEHRTWWHTAALKVHWFLQRRGPRSTYWNIRAFMQRGRRGWADTDVWNLNTYLEKVIAGSVKHLNNTKHSYHADMTLEEWTEVLDQISTKIISEDHVERAEALDTLVSVWFDLWD